MIRTGSACISAWMSVRISSICFQTQVFVTSSGGESIRNSVSSAHISTNITSEIGEVTSTRQVDLHIGNVSRPSSAPRPPEKWVLLFGRRTPQNRTFITPKQEIHSSNSPPAEPSPPPEKVPDDKGDPPLYTNLKYKAPGSDLPIYHLPVRVMSPPLCNSFSSLLHCLLPVFQEFLYIDSPSTRLTMSFFVRWTTAFLTTMELLTDNSFINITT